MMTRRSFEYSCSIGMLFDATNYQLKSTYNNSYTELWIFCITTTHVSETAGNKIGLASKNFIFLFLIETPEMGT